MPSMNTSPPLLPLLLLLLELLELELELARLWLWCPSSVVAVWCSP